MHKIFLNVLIGVDRSWSRLSYDPYDSKMYATVSNVFFNASQIKGNIKVFCKYFKSDKLHIVIVKHMLQGVHNKSI